MTDITEHFDVAVIGAGHAGCEAALAAARIGAATAVFAISLDSIAFMPCNPSVGGTSKGHLVREVDAIGGEMGKNIDKTLIQIRMLNLSKGPAVHSLRAQADKGRYSREMKKTLENTKGLSVLQAEITDIDFSRNGIVLTSGLKTKYSCGAAVLCGGTYLNARCLCGDVSAQTGPSGFKRADFLSTALLKHGIKLMRFKTGTPARIDARSVDFSKMEVQNGDDGIGGFSFDARYRARKRNKIKCHLTYTNEATHKIIRENIHRSPMYSGLIEGTGTRYCPSVEDKITRFPDKERHQVFIEPEGLNTNELYVQGVSTSLPLDVQTALLRTVPGLEACRIMRPAYAIEYDCLDATQLDRTLMFKDFSGLFAAGQINGSSGYEEAAAQGIIAGINAAKFVKGEPPLVLGRDEAYIGVLIDDIVIKGTREPYRMMTSRAEYRLLLRQDNADARLTKIGFECGLISKARYAKFVKKQRLIDSEIKRVKETVIPPSRELNAFLGERGCAPVTTGAGLAELIKRPELDYLSLEPFDASRRVKNAAVCEQVNIRVKYEGYIDRQIKQVARFKQKENLRLPKSFDYAALNGLRLEARQKLARVKPASLGEAMRITGVSPADIAVLMVYLKGAGHETNG